MPTYQSLKPTKSLALAAALALATFFTYVTSLQLHRQQWDDAFITYRTAKNFWLGHGAVYNLGSDVKTCTSLLNPVLASLAFSASDDEAAIQMLDVYDLALYIVSLWLAVLLAVHIIERVTSRPLHWLWPPLILLFFASRQAIMLGMETQLYMVFVLGSFYLYIVREKPVLGFAIGCLALFVRPDGILVPMSLFATALFVDREKIGPMVLIGLAMVGAYLGITYFAFHEILPHTAAVKSLLFPDRWVEIQRLYYLFIKPNLLETLPNFAILLAAPMLATKGRHLAFLAWGVLYLMFFTATATWWSPFGWYQVPAIFYFQILGAVSVGILATHVSALLARGQKAHWEIAARLGLVLFAIGFSGATYSKMSTPATKKHIRQEANIQYAKEIAQFLKQNVPKSQSVILEPLGIIGFYSWPVTFKDWPGLTSKEVLKCVKEYPTSGEFFWRGQTSKELKYILERIPDIHYAITTKAMYDMIVQEKTVPKCKIVFESTPISPDFPPFFVILQLR